MTKVKLLLLFDGEKHVQTVRFEKHTETIGWRAVHFDRDKRLPFYLYDSLPLMKEKIDKENLTYQWQNAD